ncbi:hypothetical protein SADUNF_Sadunf17G0065400 [Salix dunnii]|uniref:Uncharacterized protein n=1 Tax=Salix dunnii TaxID=1413687 RepID=A0A835J2V9_9ROSI|nr:hypothetical protein SADUNF_Sadunf17G0065400 [Salix dunnii]
MPNSRACRDLELNDNVWFTWGNERGIWLQQISYAFFTLVICDPSIISVKDKLSNLSNRIVFDIHHPCKLFIADNLISCCAIHTTLACYANLFSPFTKAALLAHSIELSQVQRLNFLPSSQGKNEYS